ncbi:MAG: transposase [Patescibacteria group bacterium]|nr:transposase [Patescibacteria group bacterium]
MIVVAQLPPKAQFLTNFSFPQIALWCQRKSTFEGGRPGYDKERLLFWLLLKKSMNWDYRTVASLAGVSHPTLIRANNYFLEHNIYQKLFVHVVKSAYKHGLIKGEKVAMDSSFVQTFSKKEELGSEGINGFKKGYGFKLHLLVDAETGFPLALIVGNGIAHDGTLAIPLLKKARAWLKKCGYVLADKGYDDTDIVNWIVKELKAKAGIPMRKKSKLAKGKKYRYGNILNWQLKAAGRTFKKSILRKRVEVERCFSHLKRVYHLGKEEMRGIVNFVKNAYQSLICYMLHKFWIAGVTCS